MRLCCLNLASRSTTASPVPRVKKFPLKRVWSGPRSRFWYEATLFKFCKFIDYGECHTRGFNPPPQKWVCCRSCDRCLNFNPFIISGWMRWGWWGEAGGLPTTMLCRIHSLFLNDALIYSENAILWHGVAGMSWHITLSPNTIQLCKIPTVSKILTVTPYGGVDCWIYMGVLLAFVINFIGIVYDYILNFLMLAYKDFQQLK